MPGNQNSEIKSSPVHVDMTAAVEDMEHAVKSLCIALVPGWKDISEGNLELTKISGGITNILLLVKPEEFLNIEPVTVRIFGPNTEVVIDREMEWKAIKVLSEAGFGAKLIGSFKNGVIQSFLHARTLEPTDMSQPRYVRLIAQSLAKFHQVKIPGSSTEPQLWPTVQKFYDLASSLSFDDPKKQAQFDKVDFEEIKREIENLKEVTKKIHSPIVFSHNDLLSGNFMHNEETGEFYIIDYEYGAYSYRGFDIGNHFNEYAGFDCDYNLYPDKEAQYMFFREYLSPENPHEAEESELEKMYIEANCYALASHIYWGVWSLVQARYSPIDFDYLAYFFLRFDEYKRKRDGFLALAK